MILFRVLFMWIFFIQFIIHWSHFPCNINAQKYIYIYMSIYIYYSELHTYIQLCGVHAVQVLINMIIRHVSTNNWIQMNIEVSHFIYKHS